MRADELIHAVNGRLGDRFARIPVQGDHGITVMSIGEGLWLAFSIRYSSRPELVLYADEAAALHFAAKHRRLRLRVNTSRGVALDVLVRRPGGVITRPQLRLIKAITDTVQRQCHNRNIQLTSTYGQAT